jgi:Spy/CpxP family protein refolding chaperone
MPRRPRPLILAALLAGVGLLSLPPGAAAQRLRPDPPAPQAEQRGPREARRPGRLARALRLDEAQREQARGVLRRHRDAMQAAWAARDRARDGLQEARRARRHALGGILTPEQRERVRRLFETKRERTRRHARPGRDTRRTDRPRRLQGPQGPRWT